MVLIKVDFPRPVWPVRMMLDSCQWDDEDHSSLTDAYHVELESALEQFAFNLFCDAIETDMALGHHMVLLLRHGSRHIEIAKAGFYEYKMMNWGCWISLVVVRCVRVER